MSSACSGAVEFLGVPSSICVRGCLQCGWLKGSRVTEIPTPTQMANPRAVTLELHPWLWQLGQAGKFPLSISPNCLLNLGWGGGVACKSCKFRYFLRLGSCYFLSFKEPLSALESFSSEGTFLNSETDLQQERVCQGNRPHPSCNSLSPLNFSPPNLGVLLRFPQVLLISFSLFTSFFIWRPGLAM